MTDQETIFNFIKSQRLAVVSTVNASGRPQSAVVGFGETEQLELIFATHATTRKAQNIRNNPLVSVVIGWDDNQTVQYEGLAKELSADEAIFYREKCFHKNPGSKEHSKHPDERYFLIRPTWIRYSDFREEQPSIIELKF